MNNLPPFHINLAAFCPNTHSLGPGNRSAIWVQGCLLHCPGCIATEWIPIRQNRVVAVQQLTGTLAKLPELDGLTISGGEPMLQAAALAELVRQVRQARPVNVICFSGYTLDQLRSHPPAAGVAELLGELDVLIDGPYVSAANHDQGLRGSTNQQVHYLTPALHAFDLETWPRSLEIYVDEGEMLVVGIPVQKAQRALGDLVFHPLNAPVNGVL